MVEDGRVKQWADCRGSFSTTLLQCGRVTVMAPFLCLVNMFFYAHVMYYSVHKNTTVHTARYINIQRDTKDTVTLLALVVFIS